MKKISALVAATFLSLLSLPAAAEPTVSADPKLQQTVAANEATATDKVEIGKGHVDLGVRLENDKLILMARDDTVSPPVWRNLEDTVIRVHDAGLLSVPSDGSYDFLGLPKDAKVYVIPQTQLPDVVWLGWNTQHPSVASTLKRGVTLRYQQLVGPDALKVFLHNGFDKPTLLWDSAKAGGQDLWVDLHTHTHANWIFGKPGAYAAKIKVEADGINGAKYQGESVVKFAVGSATSRDEAMNQVIPVEKGNPAATTTGHSAQQPAQKSQPYGLWIMIGLAILAVIAIAILIPVLSKRDKANRAKAFADE